MALLKTQEKFFLKTRKNLNTFWRMSYPYTGKMIVKNQIVLLDFLKQIEKNSIVMNAASRPWKRAAFSLMREPELGHLLENCVLLELRRRNARTTYHITDSGFEVDFIAQYLDGTVEVIQVSSDLSDPSTRQREFRALSDMGSTWPNARFLVINLSDEYTFDIEDLTINITPVWKWLLER